MADEPFDLKFNLTRFLTFCMCLTFRFKDPGYFRILSPIFLFHPVYYLNDRACVCFILVFSIGEILVQVTRG